MHYHTLIEYCVFFFANMFASCWIGLLRLLYLPNIEHHIEYYVTTLSSMFGTFAVLWV